MPLWNVPSGQLRGCEPAIHRYASLWITCPSAAKPSWVMLRSFSVPQTFRIPLMALLIVVAALAALAVATQTGVMLVQRAHPLHGRMVEVAGARLHVVELGPRDGLPIVMLHGASSNLEVMRPLAERLSQAHRVILLDRPGHG